MSRSRVAVAGAVALLCCTAHAADARVTPYRPSVSAPAQLPLPGQFELEAGGATATGPGRRTTLPYLFKYAFTDEWGVLLGGDAWVGQRNGARDEGAGDTLLILKRAFVDDAASAYGIELAAKLATAARPLGSGSTDWTVNAIHSRDFGRVHVDLNLNATRLGNPGPGAARLQLGAAAAYAVALDGGWGAAAELSGTRNRGGQSTGQLLVAMNVVVGPGWVADFGVARGLTRATPRWAWFAGVVLPLAKLR
jgi:hypothetical protein